MTKPSAAAAIGARRLVRPSRTRVVEDPETHLDWLVRNAVSPTVVTICGALYHIVMVRLRWHQPTKDYTARRTTEGKSKRRAV